MKTTLGSLLTVVLLRTAHHNLAKFRVRHLSLPPSSDLVAPGVASSTRPVLCQPACS